MKFNNEEMDKVLGQDIEISPLVEKRIQDTYASISGNKKVVNKQFRAVRKVAAAAAIVCALSGTTALGVYASGNGDFLQSIFGAGTNASKPAKTMQVEDGKGGTVEVTLPSNEYVAMDADTYKNVEPYVQNVGKDFMIGDHKVTVLNHVTDGNAGMVSYKVECSTGVTLFDASEEKNRTKGASFAETSKGVFYLQGANGKTAGDKMYIDFAKSTDTCYYLYQSYVCDGNAGAEKIHIYEYDQSIKDAEKVKTSNQVINEKTIDIKADQLLNGKITIKDGKNTMGEVSSLGLSFDLQYLDQFNGQVEKKGSERCFDLTKVIINYTDGSKYVVYDQPGNVENVNYMCGAMGTSGMVENLAFNRIIDASKIKSITVNNETFEIN